jgi:hypothetical protein
MVQDISRYFLNGRSRILVGDLRLRHRQQKAGLEWVEGEAVELVGAAGEVNQRVCLRF